MITDKLTKIAKVKFSSYPIKYSKEPNPIIELNSNIKEIGVLTIWDDGDESMMSIQEITHSHFVYNGDKKDVTKNEIEDNVVEQILEFIDDLLSDRILFENAKNDPSGGWMYLENKKDYSYNIDDYNYYFWSGKYLPQDELS